MLTFRPVASPLAALGVCALGLSLSVAQPVHAQGNVLSFGLTAGAQSTPTYLGAGSVTVRPWGSYNFQGLRLGNFEVGTPEGADRFAPGAGLRGAFRVLAARDGKDELAGLDDVKTAVELGVGLHYTTTNWQVYGEVRQGIAGHKGIAGDIGANFIARPFDGFTLHAGPRASFGNARFARTYFGVTGAEATAAGLAGNAGLTADAPGGGMHSLGFEIGGHQAIGRDWGVSANIRYDRLRGDAVASPIVRQGRRDQVTAQFGLTRNFNLRF